jgi:ribosomal-protein-alanine N-acetyltransferase
MDLEDIPQVLEIDRASYSVPWPANAYRREILHNRNARYVVLREIPDGQVESPRPEPSARSFLPPFLRWPLRSDPRAGSIGRIQGYAGMWLMVDEAHITTIAMRPEWRGCGLGELLLACLIEASLEAGAERVTLEVRVSNQTAQNLYRKYGFRQQGIRPRYYADDNEDAYIMTTDCIRDDAYQRKFESLVAALRGRLLDGRNMTISSPVFALAESKGERGAG